MKKIFFNMIILMVFSNIQLYAQISFTNILEFSLQSIELVESKNLEIVRIENDVLSESNNSKTILRFFSDEYTYGFTVYADNNFDEIELDLKKRTSNGSYEDAKMEILYSSDIAKSYSFSPETADTFALIVTANRFSEDNIMGVYGLIIAHEIPTSKNDNGYTSDFQKLKNNYYSYSTREIQYNSNSNSNNSNNNIQLLGQINENTSLSINLTLSTITHMLPKYTVMYHINNKEYLSDQNLYSFSVESSSGFPYQIFISDKGEYFSILSINKDNNVSFGDIYLCK